MLDEIINDQATRLNDFIHVKLIDEGYDPGTAFELTQSDALLEALELV